MISKKIFNADGSNFRFLSDFIIKSEQFTRVYNYVYDPNGVAGDVDLASGLFIRVFDIAESDDLVTIDRWDLVDNSISFYTPPYAGSRVWVEVATTSEEFGDTLTQPSVERAENAAIASENSAVASATSAANAAASEIAAAISETNAAASAVLVTDKLHTVDTIAEMLLLDVLVHPNVNVKGYTTANDGGGGIFTYDATQSGTNNGGTIIDGWVRQYSGTVNVKWFGAVGDSTTDDTTAFQNATNSADSIYMPTGQYRIIVGNIRPSDNMKLIGDGMYKSQFVWNGGIGSHADVATGSICVFRRNDTVSLGGLIFEDVGFVGELSPTYFNEGGLAIYATDYQTVEINRCLFKDTNHMAMDIHRIKVKASCTDSVLENIARDGIRFRDCHRLLVTGNILKHIGDDSIVHHNVPPFRPKSTVIRDNHIEDGYPIKTLGGNEVIISNNHLKRMKLQAIIVQPAVSEYDEGQVPIANLLIDGNIVTDTIDIKNGSTLASAYAIRVAEMNSAKGNIATNGTPIGNYDATLGKFIYRWDYLTTNSDDTVNGLIAPISNISITNNLVFRTLPSVSLYSEWGFGEIMQQGGLFTDVAVTEDALTPTNLISLGSLSADGISILGNSVSDGGTGISVALGSTIAGNKSVKIANNNTKNTRNRAVNVSGTTSYSGAVVISDNIFDIDPYRLHSNSNIDGSYITNAAPYALYNAGIDNIVFSGNTISNCCSIVASIFTILSSKNILITESYSPGFNVLNKGIGNVGFGAEEYTSIQTYSDPTLPTINTVKTPSINLSTAMPSSGSWIKGEFVEKRGRVAEGTSPNKYVILGWDRITTGANNVLNTDWIERRTLTGT